MARQIIGLGTVDNDNTGDNAKIGGGKINANFAELYMHGARAKFSADQTAQNFTAGATLDWNAEDFDTDAIHDSAAITKNRLTVPAGFTYARIDCGIYIQNITANSSPVLLVRKNGTTFAGTQGHNPGVVWGVTHTCGVLPVVAGDYFDAFLQVTGDTSIDILAARSFMSIQLYP